MTSSLSQGLALTCVAGLLAGNCMLPMKFVKRWAWENTWLVFTIVSLLVLPLALARIILGDVFAVYSSLPFMAFAAPLLFGAGWGVAQALFGLSINRLGMALTYAIIVGLGALLGTVVPLVVKNRGVTGTARGALIFTGIVVMVAGIVLSSWAGKMREGPTFTAESKPGQSGSYGWAIATAIVCGVLAPMLNYSFAFGQSIADEAVRQGSSRAASVYAIWPVALLGGSIPNIAYAMFRLKRNATWKTFLVAPANGAFTGSLMAFLWMGAMATYGVASVYLGPLGTSVGWALFQIFMIITANASGVLAGEWSGASVVAKRLLGTGLLLLGVATALIAAGGR
jgi:L-rhamnose-H+ transport protein